MKTKISAIKNRVSFRWIKSPRSGKTYLCPAGSFADGEDVSDEELRRRCIDESLNPHND